MGDHSVNSDGLAFGFGIELEAVHSKQKITGNNLGNVR
jgi:hypothetical protein